ncbi:hypothetical protein BGX27_003453, partial [Mortierella sp. AM989]
MPPGFMKHDIQKVAGATTAPAPDDDINTTVTTTSPSTAPQHLTAGGLTDFAFRKQMDARWAALREEVDKIHQETQRQLE